MDALTSFRCGEINDVAERSSLCSVQDEDSRLQVRESPQVVHFRCHSLVADVTTSTQQANVIVVTRARIKLIDDDVMLAFDIRIVLAPENNLKKNQKS